MVLGIDDSATRGNFIKVEFRPLLRSDQPINRQSSTAHADPSAPTLKNFKKFKKVENYTLSRESAILIDLLDGSSFKYKYRQDFSRHGHAFEASNASVSSYTGHGKSS